MKNELIKLIHESWIFTCKLWRKNNHLFVKFNFRWIEFSKSLMQKISEKINFEPIIDSLASDIITRLWL